MKLTFRMTGLIFGLALLLFSCEDSGLIGLDVDSENIDFKIQYQEVTLPTSVILEDSVITLNRDRLLSGNIDDGDFGKIFCQTYSQVNLSRLNPVIDETGEFDSLVLILKYDYAYGPNPSDPIDLNVHRLEEDIVDTALYFNNSTTAYFADPIGQKSFNYIFDGNSINLDTVVRVSLADQLGEELFQLAKNQDTLFQNRDLFTDYFKGITIFSNDQNTSITGWDILESRIEMHYHFTNSNGDTIISNYEFNFSEIDQYNNITIDRTGTPLAGLTEPNTEYDPGNGLVYVQNGAGVSLKIDFEPFLNFADTLDGLILNIVEFEINPGEDYGFNTRPPSQVVFYLTDDSNSRLTNESGGETLTIQEDIPNLPQTGTGRPNIVDFDNDLQGYSTSVTSYLQAVYNEEIENTEVLMFSTFSEENNSVNGFKIDKNNIKLGIYYTIADQATSTN